MQVKAAWAGVVATIILSIGTPQVSHAESTISFSSHYYYFCWNPSTQGRACGQRASKKIWQASQVPVEVELRAACKQQHYAEVFYAPEESQVIETCNAECAQGAKHQRLRRDAREERARPAVPK